MKLRLYYTGTTDLYKSTFKLDYINVPLMAKYYIIEGLSIQAGPQIGFLLSAKASSTFEVTDTDGLPVTESNEADVKDITKNVDFGVNFGVGYKMNNGLFFDARYNLGISDLADKRLENDNEKSTNRVINFAIGYSFN